MEELYLKEVEESDINILKDYHKEFNKYNKKGWVNEDRFIPLLTEWKEDRNNLEKVHFFPFWLMKDNKAIGLVIIKNNIEVDEMWREYGGNISYTIAPDYRRKGYGTKSLNLALQKCVDLGINKVLITCLDSNIASRKIIESNHGILKDTYVDKFNGELSRRYLINVQDSSKTIKIN